MPLAVKAEAVATPLALVTAVVVREAPNRPLAPEAGAVKVTVRPWMPTPPPSVTLADKAVPNALVTVVDCPPPALTAIAAGSALVMLKLAGVAAPGTVAVTV